MNFVLLFFFFFKVDAKAVDTVAEASGCRTVVEDVAQVTAAAGAHYFGTHHTVGFV